ncbi:MAG TPA: hypothetical protein DCO79_12725 [Spirochaeta sp.]|nr:hypothetical protein [Spirochaeta sp.]
MERKIIDGINAVKLIYPEARFIIFGSEATDSAKGDSDVDICVVFPEIKKDSFALAAEIAKEIRKYLDRALDVIVVDELNFNKRSKDTWTLEHTIKSEGIAV